VQSERDVPDEKADIAEEQSGCDRGEDGPDGVDHDEISGNDADGDGCTLNAGRIDIDLFD
jgi:hypothetical protein